MSAGALMVSAPASGHGKTTVTAALARAWVDAGLRVRVFKTGPDFLDPMVLARASGAPVRQLDLWMGGFVHCASLLNAAAAESDVVLVEGAMGLYDGTPSTADLAVRFGLPVLAVIDASAMAQTFGAIAHGLASWRGSPGVAAVVANRTGGAVHARMLRESLPAGIAWYGALPRDAAFGLPQRHLGLVQAAELTDLDARIAAAARALSAEGPPRLPPAAALPEVREPAPPRALAGVRVALARDAAFAFVYETNLEVLRAMGAEVLPFSPLADEPVPAGAHALWLPGGYPELHLGALATRARARDSVRAHHAAGRPILAECGGLLWLLESLADADGARAPMLGLLPGHARVERSMVNLGLQSLDLPEGTVRGHTFHHARADVPLRPAAWTVGARDHGTPEPVWREGRLTASFLHLYFASAPAAVAALLRP
ncbi:MAG: cobyrinate a,c-diamide synthase [Burkholderiales bacterium]